MSEADELYEAALERWKSVLDLSLYDDRGAVSGTTPLLKRVLTADPDHVPALELLSDLLMQIGAYDEARALVVRLQTLDPAHPIHHERLRLLNHPAGAETRDLIRAFVEAQWQRFRC